MSTSLFYGMEIKGMTKGTFHFQRSILAHSDRCTRTTAESLPSIDGIGTKGNLII